MRVDAYNRITQAYQTSSTSKVSKTSSVSVSDQVQISQLGKDYQVAKQAVTATPDVRVDKVNEIKSRMESGTYDVSDEKLADKLVDNYFNSIA